MDFWQTKKVGQERVHLTTDKNITICRLIMDSNWDIIINKPNVNNLCDCELCLGVMGLKKFKEKRRRKKYVAEKLFEVNKCR